MSYQFNHSSIGPLDLIGHVLNLPSTIFRARLNKFITITAPPVRLFSMPYLLECPFVRPQKVTHVVSLVFWDWDGGCTSSSCCLAISRAHSSLYPALPTDGASGASSLSANSEASMRVHSKALPLRTLVHQGVAGNSENTKYAQWCPKAGGISKVDTVFH